MQMKQDLKPLLVDLSSKFQNNKDISEEELILQLTKLTKGAILISKDKKNFLIKVQ